MSQELVDAMAGMKEQEALGLAKDMLDGGGRPFENPGSLQTSRGDRVKTL
jgi:hypothetical protein